MIISNFIAYAKQAWKNKPDTSTPLSAARLTHLEEGIKSNSDAIEKIAAAVVSQIVNDPNKIASMAALYSVNEKADSVISDLAAEYALAGTTFVTDFNNASMPGRYRVYNASGTAAHGPYAGSVGGYVDILTDGDTAVTGTKVYQELHDHNGDTYTRINIAGTSYGAWEHYTQDSDLGGNLQLRSKLYTGSAASGIVVTSRNNPISLENVSGQILAHVDSNQIGYVSTCPTNPVTFTVANGRVKMYVDNTFMGFITTTTT